MKEARAQLLLDVPEGCVAVVALTDNESDWKATGPQLGVNYVEYGDCGLKQPHRSRLAQVLLAAHQVCRERGLSEPLNILIVRHQHGSVHSFR